jgi:hypothetical protein
VSVFHKPGASATDRERLTVETSGHVDQHRVAQGHRPRYRIDRVRLTTSLPDHGIAGGCGSCYAILTAQLETTTTTRPHPTAAWTHAAATGTHAATSGRWFGGQCHTTRLGALLHLLMMFLAELLSFLRSLRGPHFGAICHLLLLRHELAAIDLLLLLNLSLFLGRLRIGCQCVPGRRVDRCQWPEESERLLSVRSGLWRSASAVTGLAGRLWFGSGH